jgi:pyruvate dehydrogenase E1 component alpha subunit
VRQPGDQVITGYRDHGHMLVCGMDPREVMAELTGRRGGLSRARAAPCTCSPPRPELLRRSRRSSAPRSAWARGLPWPTATAATAHVCLHLLGDGDGQPGPGL